MKKLDLLKRWLAALFSFGLLNAFLRDTAAEALFWIAFFYPSYFFSNYIVAQAEGKRKIVEVQTDFHFWLKSFIYSILACSFFGLIEIRSRGAFLFLMLKNLYRALINMYLRSRLKARMIMKCISYFANFIFISALVKLINISFLYSILPIFMVYEIFEELIVLR